MHLPCDGSVHFCTFRTKKSMFAYRDFEYSPTSTSRNPFKTWESRTFSTPKSQICTLWPQTMTSLCQQWHTSKSILLKLFSLFPRVFSILTHFRLYPDSRRTHKAKKYFAFNSWNLIIKWEPCNPEPLSAENV